MQSVSVSESGNVTFGRKCFESCFLLERREFKLQKVTSVVHHVFLSVKLFLCNFEDGARCHSPKYMNLCFDCESSTCFR